MSIDFSLSPELEEIRGRVRAFIDDEVLPAEKRIKDERLEEITRMLGGVEITDKTRAAAREMLKAAKK